MPMSCVDEMDIGGGRRLKVMCDAPGTVGPTIGVPRHVCFIDNGMTYRWVILALINSTPSSGGGGGSGQRCPALQR